MMDTIIHLINDYYENLFCSLSIITSLNLSNLICAEDDYWGHFFASSVTLFFLTMIVAILIKLGRESSKQY